MRKPCCDKQDTNKGAWSKQEDQKLVDYIRKHGEGCWRTLPLAAGLLRCGKSCRLRWINYLRPDLKRGNFAEDEEDLIIKLHALLGNRWSLIAGRLPGRSDNEVKNYWNSHLRRKLINMGIDPNNHRPGQKVAVPRRPQSQHHDSDSATSSGSKKDHPSQVPVKIRDNNNNNNKVHDSDSATSSGSKKDHPNQVPVKIRDNNNKISDAGSCLEDDHGPCSNLPDLNLDLSITISPSPSIHKFYQMEQKPNTSMVHGNNCAPSPPLLLFG